MEVKDYTCIVCPQSCKVKLTIAGEDYCVEGNICKRGQDYVVNEYTCPKRMLTTTVKVNNGVYANIPVVSESEIERSKFFECLKYLYSININAPIKMGDVLVDNINDTGVNIVAARDMLCKY